MDVRVWRQVEYDPALVEAALGESVIALDHRDRVLAPFLTLNGRVHMLTSNFLRYYSTTRANASTARRMASPLGSWLDFLVNVRHLHPHEDHRDPVLIAREEDWAAYYRRLQYGTENQVLSADGWGTTASVLKRFYQYLQRHYQHQPPFEIVAIGQPGKWVGTTIAGYAPRRRSTGSAGRPLTPEFAHLLLMGALRVDLRGEQFNYLAADRDHAIVSLALGTGLRRLNLANVTVYEIPRPSKLSFTVMHVADEITKLGAGGDTFVFTHRLPAVHAYVNGARRELAADAPYRPARPLPIVEADSLTVRYRDPEHPETTRTRRWTDCKPELRRRLVDVDGSSPILFLGELDAKPLAYSSFQHVIAGARDFVRERLDSDFPSGFRLHDCRHTYAVHLAVAIYLNVLEKVLPEHRRGDWQVDHIAAAVELVKSCLGHTSEASTRLYIQTAHRFLNLPIEQFLGEI